MILSDSTNISIYIFNRHSYHVITSDLNNNFFFFNDTETTEIYTRKDTLSLHDALPISPDIAEPRGKTIGTVEMGGLVVEALRGDRKSTRLNSSHPSLSRMPSSA